MNKYTCMYIYTYVHICTRAFGFFLGVLRWDPPLENPAQGLEWLGFDLGVEEVELYVIRVLKAGAALA